MEVMDLLKVVRSDIKEHQELLDIRKNNINSNYQLAKADFVCIDNYIDHIETLNVIEEILQGLQDRIIKRNRGE